MNTPRSASALAPRGEAQPSGRSPCGVRPASQVLALGEHLIEAQVTVALMEAASDFWDPSLPTRRRRVRGDAGQRRPRQEPARPQERPRLERKAGPRAETG